MPCPFCRNDSVEQTDLYADYPVILDGRPPSMPESRNAIAFECPDCGNFIVTKGDMEHAFDPNNGEYKPVLRHIACLLNERRLLRQAPVWLRASDKEYSPLARHGDVELDNYDVLHVSGLLSNWPRTIGERIDRAMLNLSRQYPAPGESIFCGHEASTFLFAVNRTEAFFISHCLSERGLANGNVLDATAQITDKGWEYVDKLSRTLSSPRNPAFVAMWFGSDEGTQRRLREVFENGMALAAKAAGYEAKRVDSHEFNDDIMDQVISRIRVAPFVIADYTGQRGGVYYEAGFARGLGIPVINTCSKEESKNLHFDVKQLNFIMWESPEDLCKRLQNRITATIGRGPHTFDDKVGKP